MNSFPRPLVLNTKQKAIATVVVVLLLAVITGTWYRFRMKQVQFTYTFSLPDKLVTRVAVESDGRKLVEMNPPQIGDLKVQIPGRPQRSYGPAMLPDVKVRLLYPCGWKTAGVHVLTNFGGPRPLPGWETNTDILANVSVSDVKLVTATLLVDNRDHAATTIAVGQYRREIEANEKGNSYEFSYQASCEAGRKVTVGGAPAGVLPEEIKEPKAEVEYDPNDPAFSSRFLIDTSGKRCYDYSDHCYLPVKETKDTYCFAADSHYFRKRLLHRLSPHELDYFLEEAPQKIEVTILPDQFLQPKPAYVGEGGELRHSLNETDCGGE